MVLFFLLCVMAITDVFGGWGGVLSGHHRRIARAEAHASHRRRETLKFQI
jgi:hypothetical protein